MSFAKVDCSGNENDYVREVLKSGRLTTAGKTKAFEKQFQERVHARFACAVNSCTAALHLALEAVGVGLGDKVLVPTMTFTATAEVVRYLGADPVFVDCDPGTMCITADLVKGVRLSLLSLLRGEGKDPEGVEGQSPIELQTHRVCG